MPTGKITHEVMREKLGSLFNWIQKPFPEVRAGVSPIRLLCWNVSGCKAGIGFVGKNTLLIIPGKGSYVFLGETDHKPGAGL